MTLRDDVTLPSGAHLDSEALRGQLTDAADFVVVGSGAAGAVAASTLTQAGFRVIVLEEGPWVRTRDLSGDFARSTSSLLRGAGAQFTFGRAGLTLVQGRNVGGTTTVNSAIAMRAPAEVLDGWGLGPSLDARALEPHYQALERAFEVRDSTEVAGEHNRLFERGARALGWQAAPTRRFASGCEGSGACLTGCRGGKKLAMGVTLIPDALRGGARLYSSARALRLSTAGGRATGVVARLPHGTLTVHARRGVLVCASAVQTPNLLRRSGVRSRWLGRNFQCHPGFSLAARFDHPVRMQHGVTQGFHSEHLSKSHQVKLESLSLQPELMAMSIPAAGRALTAQLAAWDELLVWAVVLKARATGRVVDLLGADPVLFTPDRVDLLRAREGLKALTRMMFAAGAREVWPNVHGLPAVLRSADEVQRWDDAPLDPRAYPMVATHLFGTARIGRDARDSVVGQGLECHDLARAWVLDSSAFPTNLGTNPQLTIMAVARLAAERLAS
ncbi:MAG: GMC family oxidoreductase [Archangiaceae bacterium]|nr:GMC family oxidoreductase [Archangiaceae bacterium]